MAIKTFGYCRVSTSEQNEDRQFQAMLDLGINDRDIFIDKLVVKILKDHSIKP